ncbi:MAG TPA: ABC transporter ATP-binding protein [Methylomirabilota bacterium]|jgi:lipopolysaccharide transport system ATP-binding protein|nr:ABC transporter ATP-binding protein [Methylomirabilota bacterium]
MSSDVVLRAEGLGKQYRLGQRARVHDTLRDALASGARALARRLRGHDHADGPDETIWALRDVGFEVQRGEAVGIVGRNGAGKSTLLKILSRITEPTTGQAWLRGRLGAIIEVGTGFHGELTGRENVYLSGAILGMRRAEIVRRFDEIVAFAEIDRFVDTPVKRYSSGMYLRLAFAVAAHLEAEILLVDEVLAVGDAAFQKKCLGKMSDVARRDRTVLFVSHNLVAVEALCGRALWLDQGRVAQDGPAGQVISQYLRSTSAPLTERAWLDPAQAPAADGVRLTRLRVRRADGDVSDRLTVATPFIIECEYDNDRTAGTLLVHLEVHNEKDVLLFDVGPPLDTWPLPTPSPPGRLRTACHIPGHLLNDGLHRVTVTVLRDSAPIIRQPEALVFDLDDVAEGRGGWYEKWPGAIRPRLAWEINVPVPCGSP